MIKFIIQPSLTRFATSSALLAVIAHATVCVLHALKIKPHAFHGDWNYTISPRKHL